MLIFTYIKYILSELKLNLCYDCVAYYYRWNQTHTPLTPLLIPPINHHIVTPPLDFFLKTPKNLSSKIGTLGFSKEMWDHMRILVCISLKIRWAKTIQSLSFFDGTIVAIVSSKKIKPLYFLCWLMWLLISQPHSPTIAKHQPHSPIMYNLYTALKNIVSFLVWHLDMSK